MKDLEKWIPWAIAAGVAFVAWEFLSVGKKAADALANAGGAIGSGLYDFFHKNQMGETLFYTATFPDSVRHTIPSRVVTEDGFFTNSNLSPQYAGDGVRYRLMKKKTDGLFYAVPA